MQNNNKPDIIYAINPFMYEIGIKNSTRIVYALLYAFTKGKSGMYFGRRKYLSEYTGISLRTISSAMKELHEKGLIEHCESADRRRKGVRCVDLETVRKKQEAERKAEEDERKKEEEKEKAENRTHPIWTEESREAAYKRIISNQIGETSADEERLLLNEYKEKGLHPKSRFLTFGRRALVRMTEEQYKALASIISASELHTYISRLEKMLIKNEETGLYCNKGHYRLIKEWISKDVHV